MGSKWNLHFSFFYYFCSLIVRVFPLNLRQSIAAARFNGDWRYQQTLYTTSIPTDDYGGSRCTETSRGCKQVIHIQIHGVQVRRNASWPRRFVVTPLDNNEGQWRASIHQEQLPQTGSRCTSQAWSGSPKERSKCATCHEETKAHCGPTERVQDWKA